MGACRAQIRGMARGENDAGQEPFAVTLYVFTMKTNFARGHGDVASSLPYEVTFLHFWRRPRLGFAATPSLAGNRDFPLIVGER